jgi:hypothetical protein
MKLSECYLGRVVQDKDKTYDEVVSKHTGYMFGHIIGFECIGKAVFVKVKYPCCVKGFNTCYYLPEDIKPLED